MSKYICESIKKTVLKNKIGIIFLLNILVIGICILFNVVQYETIDDYMIQEMLSGVTGEYNENVIYINIILSKAVKFLFSINNVINWYSIFLILSILVSCTILEGIFIRKHNINFFIIWIFATILVFLPLLYRLQYTSVAAILLITSLVGFINVKTDKWKYLKYIFYSCFFILGSMVRFQSIFLVMPFIFIYFLFEIINKRNDKNYLKEILIKISFIVITCFISFIISKINTNYYNSMPMYKNYLEYNKLRSKLHDIMPNSYNNNIQIYDNLGWSYNDYRCFYLFNHGDESIFAIDNLLKIEEGIKNNILNNLYFNVLNMISYIIIDALIILILFYIITNKENRLRNMLLLICSLGLHVVFLLMSKNCFRIIYPCYLFSFVLILNDIKLESNKILSYLSTLVYEVIVLLFIIDIVFVVANNSYLSTNYQESYVELYEYVSNNSKNAYIYPTFALQTRYITDNILVCDTYDKSDNIHPQGAWTMYDSRYNNFKEKYDIDNLYKDLIEKENVYLIDSNIYFENGQIEEVRTFLNEHYFKEEIKVTEIVNFDESIFIYKLYI